MKRKPLSKRIRFEVLRRDNFTCQYCGRKASEVELHVDHIRSVATGGGNEMENLITACVDCNLGKGRLNAVLQKKMTVSKEMMPLLRYLTDDELDDIVCEMESAGLTYLDFRTFVDMHSEVEQRNGWFANERWNSKKISCN